MQIKFISPPSGRPRGLFRKAVTLVVMIALAGLALMFTAVLLAVVLIVGALAGVYLWWKTRALRRQMREQMQNFPPRREQAESEVFRGEVYAGEVIEGEVIRVHEPGVSLKR